ncbi:S26 family signal peptidase [Sphingomonas sp. GlSt437]
MALRPLNHWGDALRAAKRTRSQLGRRSVALGILMAGLGTTIALHPRPLLVWNTTASAPLGLYAVGSAGALQTGDMVIARVPRAYRRLAAERRYLPENVPLVKRIAGGSGDTLCARGPTVFVNGTRVADRLAADRARRPMPWWTGCVTLRHGALFLLMADNPASFDGRYFGPTPRGDIIGSAWPLWTY